MSTPPGGPANTLAFDIGKTNLKLSLLAPDGQVLSEQRCANAVGAGEPYPHYDVEAIWRWLMDAVAGLPPHERAGVGSFITVTHGAALAAIDADGALVLPVMDYEWRGIEALDAEYAALRDGYAVTWSPSLPGGLNLAKQLLWFERRQPQAWARVRQVLTYPQYWSWRLCGVAALEVTSLGCHSDLWSPAAHGYAPLVQRMGWAPRLPPIRRADEVLGVLRPEVARRCGLPPGCRVLCGIHDNNASMVRHLYGGLQDMAAQGAAPAALNVVSSGTWVIVAGIGAPLSRLDASRDMQANVDAWGRPFACARFMGGREFGHLRGLGGADAPAGADPCGWDDIAGIVDHGTLALPSFAEMGGPFRGRRGEVLGPRPATPGAAHALATLYVALLTDDCLTRLGGQGDIVVEGPFTANPRYAGVLAALRPAQRVFVSQDLSGTTRGAYLLARKPALPGGTLGQPVAPRAPQGLQAYRERWRRALG